MCSGLHVPPLILTNLIKQVLYQPLSQDEEIKVTSQLNATSPGKPLLPPSHFTPDQFQFPHIHFLSPQDFDKLASGKIARFAIRYFYGQLNNVYLSHLMNVDEWFSNFGVYKITWTASLKVVTGAHPQHMWLTEYREGLEPGYHRFQVLLLSHLD